jgi:hypothetical protein
MCVNLSDNGFDRVLNQLSVKRIVFFSLFIVFNNFVTFFHSHEKNVFFFCLCYFLQLMNSLKSVLSNQEYAT